MARLTTKLVAPTALTAGNGNHCGSYFAFGTVGRFAASILTAVSVPPDLNCSPQLAVFSYRFFQIIDICPVVR